MNNLECIVHYPNQSSYSEKHCQILTPNEFSKPKTNGMR